MAGRIPLAAGGASLPVTFRLFAAPLAFLLVVFLGNYYPPGFLVGFFRVGNSRATFGSLVTVGMAGNAGPGFDSWLGVNFFRLNLIDFGTIRISVKNAADWMLKYFFGWLVERASGDLVRGR